MTATVVIDRTPIQPQLPASSPHLLERLKIRKPGATKSRVAGIDIARAVAMIGMLIAHTVLPQGGSGGSSASNPSADAVVEAVPHALSWEFLAPLHELVSGRAQATFVILAGLMVGMMAMRATTVSERWRLRKQLVIRGLILMVIGVAMQAAGMAIVQILSVYGAYFLLSPLLLTLRRRTLLAASAAMALLGPATLLFATQRGWMASVYGTMMNASSSSGSSSIDYTARPDYWHNLISTFWDNMAMQPAQTIFNGTYPLWPEIALFLFGMALGRTKLSSPTIARVLALGGLAGIVTVPIFASMLTNAFPHNIYVSMLTDTAGHSGTTACLLYGMSVASCVLGLALFAARHWPRATRPMALLGTWSLTFYLFHAFWLTAFHTYPFSIEIGIDTPTGWRQLVTLAMWVAIPSVVMVAAWATGRRGPAEALLHSAATLAGRKR